MLPKEKLCLIGDISSHSKTNILFIGDSHVRSEVPMLSVWLKNLSVNAYTVSQRSTPFLINLPEIEKGVSMVNRNKSLEALIKKREYRYIVLGGAWQAEGYKEYMKLIDESIRLIIDNRAIALKSSRYEIINMLSIKK